MTKRVEVPADAVLHYDARVVRRGVEIGVKSREERVVENPQDSPLCICSSELLLPRKGLLVDDLNGVGRRMVIAAVVVAEAAEIYISNVAGADAAEELKIFGAETAGAVGAYRRPGCVGGAVRLRRGIRLRGGGGVEGKAGEAAATLAAATAHGALARVNCLGTDISVGVGR